MKPGAVVTLLATTVGVGLIAYAMTCYPGGTVFDVAARGHSFWLNHLCDLTAVNACNGRPNGIAAPLARAGLASFAVALAAFWTVMPALFDGRPRAAAVVRGGGVLSALGHAVLTLVAPSPGPLHALVVFSAAIPGLAAGVVGTICMLRPAETRPLGALALATLLAAAADAGIYAYKVLVPPHTYRLAIPIVQRLAFLLMLALMMAVAVRVIRSGRSAARAASGMRSSPR
jgi:hypothetical protein